MSNEHHVHVEDDSVEPGDPRQFGVIDLFAFVTLAALVSAMAAPFLREMQAEKRVRLLVVASFQLVVTTGTIAFAVYQRKKLLEKAGWRIGIAYCGEIRWRHWPAVKSVVYMLLLASAQLCLAMMFATEVVELPAPYFLVYEIQLGCISGMAFARFLWRVYPNSMEFFEQGISLRGMTFFPGRGSICGRAKYSLTDWSWCSDRQPVPWSAIPE